MGLLEHIEELRSRATKALGGLVIGTVIGSVIATNVLQFLIAPYGDRLATLSPTDSILAYFRVSLMVGAILAIPLITYQLLRFILPALTKKETRFLIGSLPAITLLFLIGVTFAWVILIPAAIGFLESFLPDVFDAQWTADLYLSFVTSILFWMGVAFETPLVFFVLSLLGLVSAEGLRKQWRLAVVGSAVAAAVITPTPDPVNMFLVMIPLLALYALSIVLVGIGRRFSTVPA